MANVQVLRLPVGEVRPNRSSFILSLLYLAVRKDVLSRILHNLAVIAREFPRRYPGLKILVELLETAALGLWDGRIVPDDTKKFDPAQM